MRQALPSREDWETLLKKEGCKGGMSATIENWDDMRAEHITIAGETPLPPKDANHVQQAKKDLAKPISRSMSYMQESERLSHKTRYPLKFWLHQ